MKNTQAPLSFSDILWDAFCVSSIIGIWPRFIEPWLICTTRLNLPIRNLPDALDGFKILQFSDLHLNHHVSNAFLEKLAQKILALKPDLITFTGDFLCYSALKDPEKLRNFLCSLKAPYGCYAILGNHDYAECVSINDAGEYDLINNSSSSLSRAFKRLLTTISLKKTVTEKARNIPLHNELISLLADTPFKLLHNATHPLNVKGATLNICGFGEYMMGRFKPQEAFKNYDKTGPSIILLHNPDGAPHLKNYPGDVVLCGHTHGGQVNLPWMWKKFTLLENIEFKKGLLKVDDKWVYVNRGIGSVLPFRWFSPPELLLLTLKKSQQDCPPAFGRCHDVV